jgi:hypothetical protein
MVLKTYEKSKNDMIAILQNMNQIKLLSIIVFFVTLFSACEKVIDVELEESDKQIVIEANINEGKQDFTVKISKTAPYFDSSIPESIENAVVNLTDDANNSFSIPHTNNGIYRTDVTGIANRTYTLHVAIEGTNYMATSFMPEKVEIDSVYSEYEAAFGPHEAGHTVYFRYSDPELVPNYYRVVHYLNGEKQNTSEDLQVFDDKLNDGNSPEMPLIMKVFQPGDTVQVELIHFDLASYDYFITLGEIVDAMGRGGGEAAPANPITNWSGGILGYFSAYTSDSLSVLIE